MRRIVTFQRLTADGHFPGADGNLDWVVANDEQARTAPPASRGSTRCCFGRRTYEIFESFWRHVVEDSGRVPDPHRPGARSREHRTIRGPQRDDQARLLADAERGHVAQRAPRARARRGRDRGDDAPARYLRPPDR
jgi:hypothetical protein